MSRRTSTLMMMGATAALQLPAVGPAARRLILVRHGAVSRENSSPPLSKGAFYGGSVDVPLSSEGEAEALAAAYTVTSPSLQPIGGYSCDEVRAIWSSPMKRALFGARAVGTAIAAAAKEWAPPMDVQTFEAFREIDRGVLGEARAWCGLTEEEIGALAGADGLARCATELELGAYRPINGGESFCDVRDRVLAQRDSLLPTVPLGGAAVVVSHLWVTRALVMEAADQPRTADPRLTDIPTASVSVVDYPEGFSGELWAAGGCAAPVVRVTGAKPAVRV